jgi:DinB superfamily
MPIPTEEQINAYEHVPALIAEAITDLDERQLQFIPAIGEWSIHEVVIHLADSETVGYWRIRRALAEQGSTLDVYNEEAWASRLSYRIQERTLALQLFTALRASTAALLRLLPEDAWQRIALHAERGELNVIDIFNTYVEHGEVHLQQIEQIKHVYKQRIAKN